MLYLVKVSKKKKKKKKGHWTLQETPPPQLDLVHQNVFLFFTSISQHLGGHQTIKVGWLAIS